jgi:ribosomal protein L40E
MTRVIDGDSENFAIRDKRVLLLKSTVVCGRCGERNNTIYSKCRKCGAKLSSMSTSPLSSRFSANKSKAKKICPFCSAAITAKAKFCPKCGQRLEQVKDLPESIPRKLKLDFTKDRTSLERTVRIFDEIFNDPTYRSKTNPDLWDTKKKWYFNQKERFKEKKISNEMFYGQLESINEYFGSTVKIPEEKMTKLLTNSREKSDTFTEVAISKDVPISVPELTAELEAEQLKVLPNEQLSDALTEIPNMEQYKLEIATDAKGTMVEPVGEEKKALFSSLQYQVKSLIFEEDETGLIVRIIPYIRSMEEIRVNFDQNKIIMNGCLKRSNLPTVNIELKAEGDPRQPSWDNLWKDIIIIGEEEEVIARIKKQSKIADQLASLGNVELKIKSKDDGDICLRLTCDETKESVKIAFSLIKDLKLFFEISFY